MSYFFRFLALSISVSALASPHILALPFVDLGYTVQQATSYNETGQYLNFSNIRYAEAPVGALRFARPVDAKPNRTLQTGHVGRKCIQANPAWLLSALHDVPEYLRKVDPDFGSSSAYSIPSASSLLAADSSETEDCLFLDVLVPRKVFERRNQKRGAPVLIWIHGGGYTASHKAGSGNPAGLVTRSQILDRSFYGVVYVAINYRLGAFGWLAGPTVASHGASNAGLLDQRLALEWVQKHIHEFGGDPDQVTIMGQSAGGGSAMHQITAYGGKKPVPFQRAVVQSPGWLPMMDLEQQEELSQSFFRALNVSTIEEARGLPSSALKSANSMLVLMSRYGSYTFGPVVDGTFVPDRPGKLLLGNSFAKDVQILTSYTLNEGLIPTNMSIQDDAAYVSLVRTVLPEASPEAIDHISQKLYPPIYNGSFGYTDQVQRTAATIGDFAYSCNTNYLGRAFGNQTYHYIFGIPPAVHGWDLPYTFFNGPNPGVVSNAIAVLVQSYILNFAKSGDPNGEGLPVFDVYGDSNEVMRLGMTRVDRVKDPAASERCLWWQKGLYV